MSTEDQNQDFEKLQQLLKLKRHEQPPPRYLKDFSGQVMAQIRGGAKGGKLESFDDIVAQAPWLQRFWQAIEGKPAVSGIFAAAVCGLVVAGIFMADKTPNELPRFTNNQPASLELQPALFATAPGGGALLANSTNPMAVLPESLFSTMPNLQTAPVNGMPIPAGLR